MAEPFAFEKVPADQDAGSFFAFERQVPSELPESADSMLRLNPEAERKNRALATELEVTPEAVRQSPQTFETESKRRQIDESTLDTPVLRNFMSEGDNLALIHDEVEELSDLERLGAAWEKGRATVALGEAGVRLRNAPSDPVIRAQVDQLKSFLAEHKRPSLTGGFITYAEEGVKLVGQMFEIIADEQTAAFVVGGAGIGATVGAFGGPLAPATAPAGAAAGAVAGFVSRLATGAYTVEGGVSFIELVDDGVDPDVAAPLSHGVGLLNAALEIGGAAVVLKPFTEAGKRAVKLMLRQAVKSEGAKAVIKKAIKQYGAGVLAEVSTEVAQEIVNIAAQDIADVLEGRDPEAIEAILTGDPNDPKFKELQAQLEDVAIATFKGMTLVGLPGPLFNASVNLHKAKRAVVNEEILKEMGVLASTLKMNERDPVAFGELAGLMMESIQAEEIHIPGDKLAEWLAGKDPKVAAKIVEELGIQDRLAEASVSGTDITISSPAMARSLMGQDNFSALTQHIRTEPEGMTAEEAQEYADSGIRDALERVPLDAGVEFATEEAEQVDIAEHEQGLKGLFLSAEEAGMTPKKYEAYLAQIQKSSESAAKGLENKKLVQEQRETTEQWNKELQTELDAASESLAGEPVYEALHSIGRERLDRAQVEEAMDELKIVVRDLPKNNNRNIVATKAEVGMDAKAFAELHGFESLVDMLSEFVLKPTFEEAVRAQANEAMMAKHGDLNDQRQALIEARNELHKDTYAAVLQEELNALREAQGAKRVGVRVLVRAAKERIAQFSVNDITPTKFFNAEKRFSREAVRALRKGDRSAATDAKFLQALNFHMAKEAINVSKKIDSRRKFMEKLNRKKPSNIPVPFYEAIRELLDVVSLQPRPTEKKVEALSARANADVNPSRVDAKYLSEAAKPNVRDMTLAEFNDLFNTVRDIAHRGANENKFLNESEGFLVDETVSVVDSSIRNNLQATQKKDYFEERSRWDSVKKFGKELQTSILFMDTILKFIDGNVANGVVWKATKGRINQALATGYRVGQVGYLRRQQAEAKSLKQIYSVWSKQERLGMDKAIRIPDLSRPISHHTMLSVLLNSGNAGNIAALLESKTFTQAEIDAIHAAATKKDWKFAQSVWDYLDGFFPEVKEAEARRSNRIVEQVEAQEITNKHGEFKGGYYPIRYDKNGSLSDIAQPDTVEQLVEDVIYGNRAASHTKNGHTKSRQEAEGSRVALDIFALNSHVDQVIFDLEMGDAVNDFYKVWFHPDVKKAFVEQGFQHYWEAGNLWLRDTIQQEVGATSHIERGVRWTRVGLTISALAWNVGVSLMQPLGLSQASVKIGHKHMYRGMRQFLGSSWKGENSVFRFVEEQSGMMATRFDQQNKDLIDAQKALSSTILDRITPANSAEFLRDSFFFGIKRTQQLTDTITWLAAFDKGMEQFEGEHSKATEFADDFADSMVTGSQGSGIFSERSAVERGTVSGRLRQSELVRIWTVFISYFIAKYNTAAGRVSETNFRNPGEVAMLASDMMILYVLEAMAAGWITGQLPDNEDDPRASAETFRGWLMKETIATALSPFPGIREIAGSAKGFDTGGALGRLFANIGDVAEQASQLEVDAALIKAINNVGGTMLHYPSGQMNKTFSTAVEANKGRDVTIQEWLMGPRRNR